MKNTSLPKLITSYKPKG